jgi:hypothetical protein
MVHRVADLAELAARLGSTNVFDRRGNVLLMDSFESGLGGWIAVPSGGAAAIYPVAAPVCTGALAVAIYTEAVAGALSNIHRWLNLPFVSRMGVEIAFSVPVNARDLRLYFMILTPTRTWYYMTRWRQTTGELSVFVHPGVYQVIATPGALYTAESAWYRLKLVTDPVHQVYQRVLFNAVEYNVSGLPATWMLAVNPLAVGVAVDACSAVAASVEFFIDDFILTINE